MKLAGIAALAASCAIAVGGCGGGGSSSSTTTPSGPPQAKESIKDAASRIDAAVKSGNCDKINALFVKAYADEGGLNASSCKYLEQIGSFKGPLAAKEYGTGGAIDYYDPKSTYDPAVVMVVGEDGLWHIAYIDQPGGVIESTKSLLGDAKKKFDQSANGAVEAIRTGDCAGLLKVAYRSFGIGGGSDQSVCKRLPKEPLTDALSNDSTAKPELLGGNSSNAFYALQTDSGYYTLVMAQQPPSVNLPADAAQYAFVNGFRGS
jgi:hypothetical protein